MEGVAYDVDIERVGVERRAGRPRTVDRDALRPRRATDGRRAPGRLAAAGA